MSDFNCGECGAEYEESCICLVQRKLDALTSHFQPCGLMEEVLAQLEDNCTDKECDSSCTYGKFAALVKEIREG